MLTGWAGRAAAFAATLALSVSAYGQIIPPSERPGREIQRFSEPPVSQAQPTSAPIKLQSTTAPDGAANTFIRIARVTITGSTVYRFPDFRSLYHDLVGKKVSLQAVYNLAQAITTKYGQDGYVLSRAIVPPQNLNPNAADIRLQVVEGYVDRVEWPTTLSRFRNFFSNYTAKITAERPVNIRTIERYVLLASDLPGFKLKTSLRASPTAPAASTLVVEVENKPIDATACIDNRGTRARGPVQYLTSATMNNLIGMHEALTVSWAAAVPLRELQYYSLNYRQVLNSEGLSLIADGSFARGRPGTAELEALEFKTSGTAFDVGFMYPFVRSRERDLSATGLFFTSDNFSDVLSAPFNNDRLRGVRARLDGDVADPWGGINQFNVTFSQGFEGLGSSLNGNALASRLVGRVDFSKIEGNISRIQPLAGAWSAFAAVYGQYGFTPLLTPEQCGYGGRFFGRAFDPSQLLADSCLETIGELRFDVPVTKTSQLQLYGFSDWGWLNTQDASFGTPTTVDAASIGGGLRLGYLDHIRADLQAAKGVEGPRNDWRFFFALTTKY